MKREALFVLCAVLAAPAVVRAAGPLGQDGDPILTSRYGVDLTQGPVLASTRVTGLAGAYVAIAEGVDGNTQTPAAPAVRPPYSVDHFDYDAALGLTMPATLANTDFFNTGRGTTQLSDAEQEGFLFFNPAINLQFGHFGAGLTLDFQDYALSRSEDTMAAGGERLSASFIVARPQVAYGFGDGQLVLGAGVRAIWLNVTETKPDGGGMGGQPTVTSGLFSTLGLGFELGAVWMPHDEPFRIGAAFRSPVETQADAARGVEPTAEGDRVIEDPADPMNRLFIPDRVDQPWEVNLGAAIQLGPRPFNPRWIDPSHRNDRAKRAAARRAALRERQRKEARDRIAERGGNVEVAERALDAEREHQQAVDDLHIERVEAETRRMLQIRHEQRPRRYVLISASLLITGALEDAVGVESFLQRVVARSGQRVVFSPRLGVETELVPGWVKIRGGTYGEPSRFDTGSDRLHGTLGFDSKLFAWTVFGLFDEGTEWRIGGALDAARRYLGWGLSLGVWH